MVICGLSPHPPIIIPQVGRGEEAQAGATAKAVTSLSQEMTRTGFETLVVITPHGPTFSDAVAIRAQNRHRGDFGDFGASQVKFDYPNDTELVKAIATKANDRGLPVVVLDNPDFTRYGVDPKLDHGTLVPLHFLKGAGFQGKLLVVNIGFLPYTELYQLGKLIEDVCQNLGRKVAVLASGDLSHRLEPRGPGGFDPKGKIFDELLMEHLKYFDVSSVLNLPADLVEGAGECGLRPISIMLGVLDGYSVSPEVLSYEGPFGVGYGVALFRPTGRKNSEKRSFPVSLARKAVEEFVRQGTVMPPPSKFPPEFLGAGGVFVSIHSKGMLRGCIGTTEATTDNLVQEIISNAISAATQDPRFEPVKQNELYDLEYSVDVLSPAEEIDGIRSLDPKKYGVICQKGRRRGLLLPDLPGVDTAREQVSIAKQKAGISWVEDGVKLLRFTVTRYK